MQDWNVVISVHQGGFVRACELLEQLGPVSRTDYFNVLVMKVRDVEGLMETLSRWISEDSRILAVLARVIPLTQRFHFQTIEEFGAKAREAVLTWVSDLAGKGFHVRMHRRGLKGRLSSHREERFLSEVLLGALEKDGTPGRIVFEDPDAIVAVETVGNETGMSLWSREALKRYPFLKLD